MLEYRSIGSLKSYRTIDLSKRIKGQLGCPYSLGDSLLNSS